MKVDKRLIHTMNKYNVLSVLREAGQINKAEIARHTRLSIPTVMKITDELLERGVIKEIGKGESSGGKPPLMLEFVPDCYYIVGVDIGTTNITCIVMDLSAHIVHKQVTPTGVGDSPEQIIERIIATVKLVMAEAKVDSGKLLGIGFGMPGLLDSSSGTVLFSPDFKWEMVELLPAIRSQFTLPVYVENVTRTMALGQRWFGYASGGNTISTNGSSANPGNSNAGSGIDSFVCVNLGHGIGSALYLNGSLYSGVSGSSGELGHMMVDRHGPRCVCGNVGCLEAIASGDAIANTAISLIKEGQPTSLAQLSEQRKLEAKDVFQAALQNDELATKIISNAAEYIGTALALVINLIDPEAIILEGGLSRAGEAFIQNIRQHAQQHQMKYAGRKTRIVVSELGEDSAAIGAATLILKGFFEAGGDVAAL